MRRLTFGNPDRMELQCSDWNPAAVAQRDLRRIAKCADKLLAARRELELAIMAAVESGETLRDIAPYAGLSASRLHEIVREARRAESG